MEKCKNVRKPEQAKKQKDITVKNIAGSRRVFVKPQPERNSIAPIPRYIRYKQNRH